MYSTGSLLSELDNPRVGPWRHEHHSQRLHAEQETSALTTSLIRGKIRDKIRDKMPCS